MEKLRQAFETKGESKPDFYSILCHAIRQMNPRCTWNRTQNRVSGWFRGHFGSTRQANTSNPWKNISNWLRDVHAAFRPGNVLAENVDVCFDIPVDMTDSDSEERNMPSKGQPEAADLKPTSDHCHHIDIMSSLCYGNDEENSSAGDTNRGPDEIDGTDPINESEEGSVSECSLYSSRNATESDQIGPGRVLGNLVSVAGRAVESGLNRMFQKFEEEEDLNIEGDFDAVEVVSVSIKAHTDTMTVSVVACSIISSKTDTDSNITGAGRVVGIAISWAGYQLENRINQAYGKVVQRRQADQNSRMGMSDTSPTRSRGKIRWADETANSSRRSKDMRKTVHGGRGHYPEHGNGEQEQGSRRTIAWRNAPGNRKTRGLKWLRRM